MKKILTSVFAIAVIMTSCGGGGKSVDPTSTEQVTQASIEAADSAVPLAESPIFGSLPSMYMRQKAATDSVSRFTRVPDDADSETKKLAAKAWDESRDNVAEHYQQLLKQGLDSLAGKDVPIQFYDDEFDEGKAVIGTELRSNEIDITFDMTLARALGFLEDNGITFDMINKDNEVYKTSKSSSKIFPDCYLPDGTITTQTGKGVHWKSTYSFYLPDLADAAVIRVSFTRK